MPGRKHPFIINAIYHIYNKTIEDKRLFNTDYAEIFCEICRYYRSSQAIIRFSNYIKSSDDFKKYYNKRILNERTFRVEILAFCFMPNHFHFLLRQKQQKGISFFISQIQNSITRYYNIKNKRVGPIFLTRFKSKLIQDEKQLKHVSRYIHLNPYSAGVVSQIYGIKNYQWSSFNEYLQPNKDKLSQPDYLLAIFNNKQKRYEKFVLDNAQHQKTLEYCKYTRRW